MRKSLSVGALTAGILWAAVAVSAAEKGVSEFIKGLRSPDEAARVEAAEKLAAAGPEAASAVPALIRCLKDDSAAVRAHAADALGSIGAPARPAVPLMVSMIGDPDPMVRRQAIEAVRSIRPGPKVVLPLLAKVIEHADPLVRLRALNALADHGDQAVPALIEALQKEDTAYWACLVIAEIGPDAEEAVPALIELLDDDHHLRREAILALASIGQASAPAAPALAAMLDDKIHGTPATYALGMIGKLPAEAIEKIEKNVKSSDPITATVSAWVLAKLNPDDKKLVRQAGRLLIARMMDKDPGVRSAAAQAILDLKPGPKIMQPLWEKALEKADERVLVAALDTMAGLGAPAVPRLIAALEFEGTRPHVAYILGKIGPEAAPAVEALVKHIDDDDPEVQREVLFALGKIGPAAKVAVPALVKALGQREGPDCYAICYALGNIGPDAIDAEAALQEMLKCDDESLPLFSAWALAKIHPDCPKNCAKTVPILARGLEDPDAQFRVGTAEALCCLGKLARDAVPALRKALDDDDEHVRQAAADALKAIGE